VIESQYQAAVQKRLPPFIYKWSISDKLQGGVPDAFYRHLKSLTGKPLWAEFKFVKKLPKTDSTMVVPNLSAQQLIWLRQAIGAGEKACVIVGCEEIRSASNGACGVILYEPDEWVNGISTLEFRKRAAGGDYETLCREIVSATS
jgi:hypothetical protein